MDSANRGLLEDVRMGLEVGVTKFIELVRVCVRKIFFLPAKSSNYGLAEAPKLTRHHTAPLPASPPFPLPSLNPFKVNSPSIE